MLLAKRIHLPGSDWSVTSISGMLFSPPRALSEDQACALVYRMKRRRSRKTRG